MRQPFQMLEENWKLVHTGQNQHTFVRILIKRFFRRGSFRRHRRAAGHSARSTEFYT